MKWRVLAAAAAVMTLAGCHDNLPYAWLECDFKDGGCPPGTVRPREEPYDKECSPMLCSVPRSPACPKGEGKHKICQSSMAEALPWSGGDHTYRITWDETFGGFPSYIVRVRKGGSAVIQATPHTKPKRLTAEEASHFEEVLKQSGFSGMPEFVGSWGECFDGTALTVEAQTPEGYRVVEVDCADSHTELREPLNVMFALAKAKGID